ncbi:MAG: DNA translocase FtsK [Candidatus Omnitrophica bacterium]|nr:DNA translocase FtsK [Candidatus Omnitrophota bacterium]
MQREKWEEILGVIFLAIGIIILFSFISYTTDDLSFYTSSPNIPPRNFIRIFGAIFSGIVFFLFGYAGYFIPLFFIAWAVKKFLHLSPERIKLKIFSLIISGLVLSGIFSMMGLEKTAKFKMGGFIGHHISLFLLNYFGRLGAWIILMTLGLLSIILVTDILLTPYIAGFREWFVESIGFFKKSSFKILRREKKIDKGIKGYGREKEESISLVNEKKWAETLDKPPEINITPSVTRPREEPKEVKNISHQEKYLKEERSSQFVLPSFDLLESPPPIEEREIKEDLEENSRILEETLRDFSIEAKVVRVERGPVVTLYELQPAPGVKINKIVSLSDDIALVMKASSVRVVAPLPGRGTVGVEVPNSLTTLVYLRDILEVKEFRNANSKLAIALGKDISGNPLISNLQDMPHLLIAGATGSGKTVCVNTIIMSILFRATPYDVRFILIDPKMVELAMFNGLPHLLSPVVTDAKKTALVLSWLVEEMEWRYRIFARLGVRNIEGYNEKIDQGVKLSAEDFDEELANDFHTIDFDKHMPYIVTVIDELADLMVVASREIEEAITRLAHLSRAVGIHLILATQRPSVDVVTGVIKANFPARISFRVASKVDSRTVLDMNGADKLLGKGDMLFLRPGTSKPIRAQGSLVSDREIERVVEFLKKQAPPAYNEFLLKDAEKRTFGLGKDKDELYDEAVKVVLETGQASASILQRRLRLGFTRAARLIDMMEEEGIVGPYRGAKPREILVNKEELTRDPNIKEQT